MSINNATVEKIAQQAIQEVQTARTFKQGKVQNWTRNETMYYGRYVKSLDSRSSVQLGRMQEFVHTLLSKIDNPLIFKFVKRKNSQLERVELLNALRQIDQNEDNWDIKDIVGKKQAIIYGRAIYFYYADSVDGCYRAHLEPVDVYDFLIDPQCGGIDIEEAAYMGAYSVVLNKKALRKGVKDGIYIKSAVDELLQGDGEGNSDQWTQEETNKQARTYDQNTTTRKVLSQPANRYKFWRWFTTYDGDRYYLVMDNSGRCIRCEKLSDVFSPTKKGGEAMWPIWTWAAFPDLTEFWTPSYADYVRDIFMAQDVTINQSLDNAEAINKPMKVVNVGAIANMAELKYRRDGIIRIKGDMDINRAFQTVLTPSIDTPIKVFQLLEGIQEKASGVTSQSKGVSDEQGKVGIYEGNEAAAADRFGLLNKSYSFGYKRFAKLYEMGVRDNLIKKVAVEIVGPEGVEMAEVKRSDIFRKGDTFGTIVEASNAQTMASKQDRDTKLAFLARQANNASINQEGSFEIQAKIAGFNDDEIERLLDKSFYGNSKVMSEADRDLERLLDGDDTKPNQMANNAYKQRMVNYVRDHMEDISDAQFMRITEYIGLLEPIIMRNEARNLQQDVINKLNAAGQMVPPGIPGQAPPPASQSMSVPMQPPVPQGMTLPQA
jgi:hypothetical protein